MIGQAGIDWGTSQTGRESFNNFFVMQSSGTAAINRLPLVGEIPYDRGNEEFVGGRGNLRGNDQKVGET